MYINIKNAAHKLLKYHKQYDEIIELFGNQHLILSV